MNIHEYQAKRIFAHYGIPVPEGHPAINAEEARRHAEMISGSAWIVKAQIHGGGRGKAGGVKKANTLEEVATITDNLVGTWLVTHQTGPKGQPIDCVLIEEATAINRELYLSLVIDRARKQVAIIASNAGGMDIEQVAAKTPERIITRYINQVVGIQDYQCREIGFALGLDKRQRQQFSTLLPNLYRMFIENDLSLVEINPLITTADRGDLLAIDAKINIDDNALYRHTDLFALHDSTQEDEKEHKARQFDLNYIALDGDIACMVNGAGLAMATMDVIKMHGGEPANFLDVGGNTTAERVTEAFKIILSDTKVRAILVNIFGGIVKCDLVASGLIYAIKETKTQLPIVIRLEGTNVEAGRTLLQESGLAITTAIDLDDAAEKIVEIAKGQAK
ncbi:MAG: succinate--CoA ligase subunit beta [Beggiatoa sp. IS2]|nr:MAG: succinate--CoA ligase subunit beta [Beggiatoa sp. IS2]